MAMNKVAMNDEEMDQVTGGSILPYSVQSGDTLWALAQEYGPADMDVRTVVYQICQLNGISAKDLQPGQYITIPTEL